jgi:hypothetical protein
MSKPLRISTPCDKTLRQALRNRPDVKLTFQRNDKRHGVQTITKIGPASLRTISKATGIPFNTINNYANEGVRGYQADGESETLETLYKSHLTLEQAEALAKYFGLRLMLEPV